MYRKEVLYYVFHQTGSRRNAAANHHSFWKGLRDEENGGFYGYMDFDLKLDKQAEKGCILNSRILWFFSEAAMLTGRADLAEDARHTYQSS